MAISGTQKAYLVARSGIARSGATRSGYLLPYVMVEAIRRDGAGVILGRDDLTPYVRFGSLQVTQALNDEPDTCSFQIVPTAPPEVIPPVGREIQIAWTPGDPLFRGYALVVQHDRRPMNQSPWVSVQCQDTMWRFDARIVTYRFPAQSVSASIAFLVKQFCNDAAHPSAIDFVTSWVDPALPSIPAFEVVNQRPSTVMRTLTAAIGGGFYIDGRDVHAWANSLTEPNRSNPVTLTNTLPSLKAFRITYDATQLRKRVLVEGKRASSLIPVPTAPGGSASGFLGLAVNDATIFRPATGPDAIYIARLGHQWVQVRDPIVMTPAGANPPQSRLTYAYAPPGVFLYVNEIAPLPPPRGWVRISGQFSRYSSYTVTSGVMELTLPAATFPYGVFTVPMPAGETVDFVDAVMSLQPLGWDGDADLRAQPSDTPIVTLADAKEAWPYGGWPPIEAFVQDGRYSYEGANNRAAADLDAFREPLASTEWETDDLNAQPGRQQQIALTGASSVDTITRTVTITTATLTFPLRTELPRRRCVGGELKRSTFLDLVLTDES